MFYLKVKYQFDIMSITKHVRTEILVRGTPESVEGDTKGGTKFKILVRRICQSFVYLEDPPHPRETLH